MTLVFILNALYQRGNALHLLRRADAFQFQRKHGEVDEHGQDHNRPAVVVHPVLVDEAQPKEKRFGDEGEPSEVHQGIQRGLFGAQHIQVFRPHEHPKGQRLRLRLPQLRVERAGLIRVLPGPVRGSPGLPAKPEGLIRRIGQEDSCEVAVLQARELKWGGDQAVGRSVSVAPQWSDHLWNRKHLA